MRPRTVLVVLALTGAASIGCSVLAISDEEAAGGIPAADDSSADTSSPTSDGSKNPGYDAGAEGSMSCKTASQGCSRSSECCVGLNCRRSGGAGSRDECKTCGALGASCNSGYECCSGPCDTNLCAMCRGGGSQCGRDDDCCSHNCDNFQNKCR